jgi:hypothetical protein
MRKASVSEIAAVPGIGEKIAGIIEENLQAKSAPAPAIDLGTGEIRG